jgi:hypothetical protein
MAWRVARAWAGGVPVIQHGALAPMPHGSLEC